MPGIENTLRISFIRAKDRMWDYRLAIHTRGLTQITLHGSEDCVTLPYGDIMQILASAGLSSTDVFVDIGCGKGRVLCCAARFTVRKVIGIEHAPDISAIALKNASRLRGGVSPISVLNMSATEYDFHEGSVLYMYNPFNASIMNQVLGGIYKSLVRHQRSILIIYANPVHEHCLSDCTWLTMVARWETGNHRRLAVPVSFWRTQEFQMNPGNP